MRDCTRFAVPVHRNPQFLPGAVAVMALLLERNYAQNYREAIGRHASIHGELSGAVDAGLLDREDLETAEAVFVDALEPVPGDSPAWDDPAVYLDVELLAHGLHPAPKDAAPDRPVWTDGDYWVVPPDESSPATAEPAEQDDAGREATQGDAGADPDPANTDQPDGFDEALARFEADHPVRSPLPASFLSPGAWQQLGGDFPAVPAPIRGGAPAPDRHAPESLEAVSVALYGANRFA